MDLNQYDWLLSIIGDVLKPYGPSILGFLIAFVLSCSANILIGWGILKLGRKANLSKDETTRVLNLDLATSVGNLERTIYIYTIMADKIDIIGARLVLKSFFFWVYKEQRPSEALDSDTQRVSASRPEEVEQALNFENSIQRFHIYIFGNGLFLIVGILCGHLGNIVRDIIRCV